MNNEEGIKEVFFILVKKIWVKLYNTVANLLNKCLPNKAKIKNISFNLFVIGSPTNSSIKHSSEIADTNITFDYPARYLSHLQEI